MRAIGSLGSHRYRASALVVAVALAIAPLYNGLSAQAEHHPRPLFGDTLSSVSPGLGTRVLRGMAAGAALGLLAGAVAYPANSGQGADNFIDGALLFGFGGLLMALPPRGAPPSPAAVAAVNHGTLAPGLRLRIMMRENPWVDWTDAETVALPHDSVAIVGRYNHQRYPLETIARAEVFAGHSTKTREGLRYGSAIGVLTGLVTGSLVAAGCGLGDHGCTGGGRTSLFTANVIGFGLLGATIGGFAGSYGHYDHWMRVPNLTLGHAE